MGVTEYFKGGRAAGSCVVMLPSPAVVGSVAEVGEKVEDELGTATGGAADIGVLEERVVSSLAPEQKSGLLATVRNIPLIKAAILCYCFYKYAAIVLICVL